MSAAKPFGCANMITLMAGPDTPGAYAPLHFNNAQHLARVANKETSPIYICELEAAKGTTVDVREANGRDDSDFFATYWDGEKFVEIEYASTRGWTYAANAVVDADAELMKKYRAHGSILGNAYALLARIHEERTPRKGKLCKILPNSGKAKHLAGETGVIFWAQEQKSQYGTWSRGWRVGVDVKGERVFINGERIQLLTPEGEPATTAPN